MRHTLRGHRSTHRGAHTHWSTHNECSREHNPLVSAYGPDRLGPHTLCPCGGLAWVDTRTGPSAAQTIEHLKSSLVIDRSGPK